MGITLDKDIHSVIYPKSTVIWAFSLFYGTVDQYFGEDTWSVLCLLHFARHLRKALISAPYCIFGQRPRGITVSIVTVDCGRNRVFA